jgi:NAD(P)-dependent dehydrogenase (short-subunit alcohol dehydrogenase family)
MASVPASAASASRSKRVFITGGASGFGRALAERYTRAGHRVCIGDIHEERGRETLRKLRETEERAEFVHCDVTRDEHFASAAAFLDERWGGVDVVINNAGVAVAGAIAETPMADWAWIVDINLLGVVRGCRTFAPRMAKQKSGQIINVSSMAGLIHPPTMAAYNATKAAVVALSETLAVELAPDNIRVSVVCPGFFRTNLVESLRTSNEHARKMTSKLVDKAERDADDVADYTFRAAEKGDFHILPHPEGQRVWALKRLSPWRIYERILRDRTKRMRSPADAGLTAARRR